MYKFILFVFIFFGLTDSFAQTTNIQNLQNLDLTNIKLPSLEELFENARKSPAVELYNVKKEEAASALKSEKRRWLHYFSATSTYQYGRIVNNSSFSNTETPMIYQYSGQNQNWWSVGAAVSVPFDDLFDRKNRIRLKEFQMEESSIETEKWHDEQKLRIIEVYMNIVESLAMLKIKTEAVVMANAQYKVSENDFINGKITAQNLSTQKSIQASAVTDYEQIKANLTAAILKLEILSKTPIINREQKQ